MLSLMVKFALGLVGGLVAGTEVETPMACSVGNSLPGPAIRGALLRILSFMHALTTSVLATKQTPRILLCSLCIKMPVPVCVGAGMRGHQRRASCVCNAQAKLTHTRWDAHPPATERMSRQTEGGLWVPTQEAK
jgi:hypothetical protein